jgi:beta-mannan synthase
MDLSLRAYLKGWKFQYLHDVECVNELPSSFPAYRVQQFRWLAGPMQIFRKSLVTIYQAKNVPLFDRLNCYGFFLRYPLFALMTILVLLVPAAELFRNDEVRFQHWQQIYFFAAVNAAIACYLYITPFSLVFLLFSVATSYFKTVAMVSGFLNLKQSHSWKVTPKFGALLNQEGFMKNLASRIKRPYMLEGALAGYYGFLAFLAFNLGKYILAFYTGMTGVLFLVACFGSYFL